MSSVNIRVLAHLIANIFWFIAVYLNFFFFFCGCGGLLHLCKTVPESDSDFNLLSWLLSLNYDNLVLNKKQKKKLVERLENCSILSISDGL